MNISFWLNGAYRQEEIEPGMLLLDFLREKGCFSVKRGCETANCGLCTVLLDERPVLSCSMLAARIDGKSRNTGRYAERGAGVWKLSCKRGGGAVWILQPWIYYECIRNAE